MLYPFMTLDDNTEIVHSENYFVDGKEQVKVEIEKPIEGGFASAECILPAYVWKNVSGFSQEDIDRFQEFLESVSHIIIDLARNGGTLLANNASKIPDRKLRIIMSIIEARHKEIEKLWFNKFGTIDYYC